MMRDIQAVHQFHPSCVAGDGVTKSMFFFRKLLRKLGFASEIYCEHIAPELRSEVLPLQQLERNEDFLLLHHHSLGYRNSQWLESLAAPKVLVYHNITPPHLLPEGDLRELSRLGRIQLAEWVDGYIGAIGVSEYNSDELNSHGYRRLATLPILVDLDELASRTWDQPTVERLRSALNIVFVGRISENKRQHELIEVFDEFLHFTNQPARLVLAGGITSEPYYRRLQQMVVERGDDGRVLWLGKVDDAVVQSLYRVADIFLCLSEHEGFCMPVIEAMMHDVPVVARDAGALAHTMGPGGLLLRADQTDPRKIAGTLQVLMNEPGLRRQVIQGQRRNLERYRPDALLRELAAYLDALGCTIPRIPAGADIVAEPPYWQVEGPIDSTYSLAIVNRELGMALSRRGHDVGLYRCSGRDGGSPDPHWLETHAPEAAALAARAEQQLRAGIPPKVLLRFNYPPWVDGMRGEDRIVHSYGWEESGFPYEYVSAFNRRLDMVTTLSQQVRKILRDSGVRVPIVVTGTGVDHLLHETPRPFDLPTAVTQARFRFLHVSSCFPRKGVDVLLEAYAKAFRRHDDVVLIIKTFPNPHNDVAKQVESWKQRDDAFPDVVIIEHDIAEDQLMWLYQQCHALVAPSRGEGFGMPLAEAMLFNVPVITTAWGGQTDFCTRETAWLCDYDFAFSQSHLGVPHSVWAEPKVEHLAALMREVYEATPAQLAPRLEAARSLCLREFTWDQVARRTEQAVALLDALPVWRKQPRIGWVTTWNTRCGIANYAQFLATGIPTDRMLVLATRSTDVVATDQDYVTRCWEENIDAEHVDHIFDKLIEEQAGAVVIQYNFAFFSVRALGSLVRQLREKGIPSYVFLHATADVQQGDRHISLREAAHELALAERLVVHGVADLNRLKSFGLVDNVLLFPHGVLPPLPPADANLRAAKGLDGKKVVATYGFLLPHKGAQPLLKAIAQLAKADPSYHLLMVNALYPASESLQEKRECEALIAELGISERVTMVTDFLPDDESLAWLRLADLIVYPYQFTQESSSAAVRGGLAAGRPVAVTPLSIFDDVADAVHRLPGTDVDDLAKGIGALLNDEPALNALAERGRAWCEPRQWPHLSARLLDLIDGIANEVAL